MDFSVGATVEPVPAKLSEPAEEAAIYQAIVLGVRDYVNKNGFPARKLAIRRHRFGVDPGHRRRRAGIGTVEAVLMPSRYTAEMSNSDAEQEARALGVSTI